MSASFSRREFLGRAVGSGSAALFVAAGVLDAQQRNDANAARDTMHAMDATGLRPVTLPPKPGATPLLSAEQRDDLEHRLHCQCGTCTLSVYTCRTTDFTCPVSPAMHRAVMELVRGGYSAQEIIDAFVSTYGEKALMAPNKSGFNLLAWFAPGTAVLVGAVGLGMLLRRWGQRSSASAATRSSPVAIDVDATPDELARLEAAVRGERHE